jgi:cytochrome P450
VSLAESEIADFPVPRAHPLDPPEYRKLTGGRPIIRVRTSRGDLAWLVTRYEDARAVLTDPRFSSNPRTPGYPTYLTGDLEPPPGFFMQFDAPEHNRLRRTVSREFVTARMEALRPRMNEVLNGLIDAMVSKGNSGELIEQLALPMASIIICEFLGVSPDNMGHVKALVDVLLDRSSTPEQAMGAAGKLTEYFDGLINFKKQNPSNDLLGMLVANSSGSGGLSHPELIGIATLLLLGGYDTMVQMIGLGVLTLLEHPDQLAELKADETKMPGAVEELLRYLTVNHAGLPRSALEDVEVGGQMIRKHEGVLVMINAANRDPSVFPNPDALDIRRDAQRHMAFGFGLHKCIGLVLARIELETVFSGLFRRLPNLHLTQPLQSLTFRHDMVLYGVSTLPAAW